MHVMAITKRIRELALQPYLRPGGENFDCAYALSVMEAQDRVALQALIDANPGKAVRYSGWWEWGYVPDGD